MNRTIHPLEPRRLFAAGVLDPTFGGEGYIVRDFDGRTNDNVSDIVVQPDGKVVAVVPGNGGAVPPSLLVRYNKDGTLDPTFGSGGRVNLDFGNWRGVVAPEGVSGPDRKALLDTIDRMAKSNAWKEILKKNNWDDAYLPGDAFAPFLKSENDRIGTVLKNVGLVK